MAEYRAGFNHCVQEVTKNLTIESHGSEKLKAGLMNHLALCCQGNLTKTSSVSSSTAQRFSTDNRTSVAPIVAPMWVYPSPPPSPLQMSPPVSPTVPLGISHSMTSLHCASYQEVKPVEESSGQTQKLSSNNRLWRPWIQ